MPNDAGLPRLDSSGLARAVEEGATDSRFLRPRDIPSYGFFPTLPQDGFLAAHGHDERLSLESLAFGLKTLSGVIARYAG
ncbi:MAG: hypothetical protein ACYC9Q_04645 [Bacillota bacterium]